MGSETDSPVGSEQPTTSNSGDVGSVDHPVSDPAFDDEPLEPETPAVPGKPGGESSTVDHGAGGADLGGFEEPDVPDPAGPEPGKLDDFRSNGGDRPTTEDTGGEPQIIFKKGPESDSTTDGVSIRDGAERATFEAGDDSIGSGMTAEGVSADLTSRGVEPAMAKDVAEAAIFLMRSPDVPVAQRELIRDKLAPVETPRASVDGGPPRDGGGDSGGDSPENKGQKPTHKGEKHHWKDAVGAVKDRTPSGQDPMHKRPKNEKVENVAAGDMVSKALEGVLTLVGVEPTLAELVADNMILLAKNGKLSFGQQVWISETLKGPEKVPDVPLEDVKGNPSAERPLPPYPPRF